MRPESHRGQTLAEFALVLPILLILFMALFDMGRAVFAYNTVSNAARSALRVAIVDQTDAVVVARAREEAIGLDGPELTVNVDDVLDPDCRLIGCTTRVEVTYAWQAITPIIGGLIGPITLTAASEMPIERVYPVP